MTWGPPSLNLVVVELFLRRLHQEDDVPRGEGKLLTDRGSGERCGLRRRNRIRQMQVLIAGLERGLHQSFPYRCSAVKVGSEGPGGFHGQLVDLVLVLIAAAVEVRAGVEVGVGDVVADPGCGLTGGPAHYRDSEG
uniref:Uncharacterized protein n=1 Tax=Chromera velia CCMP2878 TaxID=1169474 RepID=A0A0G4FWT0_9ALVE|eukprot:Cvel_19157.t1-p1 / transcript=Cvel_19157.t1 / gene=Cvel_19157 / organism=Chromera_velia_CCMP2878 / gene_product=hypothetical protein / transcript_product=hypothetical protein / location=Cvel_scaffold1631:10680-15678(-) / protein_length=135 / sequence_SO=supercontig / SO=protein_coding / is_pseudo=false